MASKTAPFFQVEPDAVLVFNYVPRKYLNSNIRLTNVSDQPLAFKVKTNVPTCYLVKPHIGTLPPHHSTTINITMQPTDYNPQTASISDKFLINVIPLPIDTDLAGLADQTRFQQTWESCPKTQVQNHKLKVVLKFENVNRSNTTPDRVEKTPEDPNKQSIMSDEKKAEVRSTASLSSSKSYEVPQDNREELKNSGMMMSFGNTTSLQLNSPTRSLTQGQGSWLGTSGDQGLATSQTVVFNRGNEDRERGEKETREALRPLEEKVEQLGKRIDELVDEKRVLMQRHQELTGKAEEQKRMLFELSEENTRLKSELGNLKSSTFLEKSQKKGQADAGTYQLWQLLVVSFVAMVIGAYMSSS